MTYSCLIFILFSDMTSYHDVFLNFITLCFCLMKIIFHWFALILKACFLHSFIQHGSYLHNQSHEQETAVCTLKTKGVLVAILSVTFLCQKNGEIITTFISLLHVWNLFLWMPSFWKLKNYQFAENFLHWIFITLTPLLQFHPHSAFPLISLWA